MTISSNVFFIRPNSNHDFTFENIKKSGYRIDVPYKGNSIFFRIVREIWFKFNLPFKEIWFNNNVNTNNCSTLIVYDPLMTPEYLVWLRRKNMKKRIILFYGNPVSRSIKPDSIPDNCCEKWSWDQKDCEIYGMHYVMAGYWEGLQVTKGTLIYDVLFVGRDKGRAKDLLELKKTFQRMRLKIKMHIVSNRRFQRYFKPFYGRILKYDEILSLLGQSRAVLDIVQENQSGLSTRAMESIFNEIKLITNNRNIVKYDFYDKENVFILEQDDIITLPEFLRRPYKKINDEVISSYTFDNWVKRILSAGDAKVEKQRNCKNTKA